MVDPVEPKIPSQMPNIKRIKKEKKKNHIHSQIMNPKLFFCYDFRGFRLKLHDVFEFFSLWLRQLRTRA